MKPNSASVLAGAGGEAYVQWVRRAVARASSSHEDAGMLFASSVEEPIELLRRTVAAGFAEPVTSRYKSVFVAGNPFVMEHLARRYEAPIDSILPTTGATGALSLLYRSFLAPGDHVLVESPGFDLFADIAHALRAHVDCFGRRGERFTIDLDEIEDRIQSNTRLIVLSNLHNPSGMLIDDDVLRAVAGLAERHGVKVIVDEVYGDYADEAVRPQRASQLSPTLISVSSLTKIYGLSTLRCGWIVAQPEVLAPVRALNDQFEFGVSKLAHAVAALVMDDGASFDAYWRGVIAAARPVMQGHFDGWAERGLVEGLMPEFGCIMFPRLLGIADTKGFSSWLADRHGVIVVPGELFGSPGRIRIGFAQDPEELDRALSGLGAGLREYRAQAPARQQSA